MIFYQHETTIGLVISSLPSVLAAYLFFIKGKEKAGINLLLLGALLTRLLMISLDPFVHEWDERFHALVARNMMDNPFKPMLFTHHIVDYNYHDWGYNHIWVHKQPLFLWQMALSMKIFGVNTIALRLPSAIMGTILVWLTYDICQKWKMDRKVSFMAAMLVAYAGYALGLISGWKSLDHNDFAFLFYMTCSFWAFTKYVHSGFNLKWALCIGLFAGLAILNKWLTGLLVFGGWGLYLMQYNLKTDLKKYLHFGYGLIVCILVFVPWQLYILHQFPLESAIAFETNRRHMSEDLGHPGNNYYHLNFLGSAYHWILIAFTLPGLIAGFLSKRVDKKLTFSFVAMIIVLFAFFSMMVATKMPAFVYPVSCLVLILVALGIFSTVNRLFDFFNLLPSKRNWILFLITLVVAYLSFKPNEIVQLRHANNQFRNNKMNNAEAFKQMDDTIIRDYVILNTRPYENIELMFYKGGTAYHWYPPPPIIDSLQNKGYKFATFEYLNDPQQLPVWIKEDKEILILSETLK